MTPRRLVINNTNCDLPDGQVVAITIQADTLDSVQTRQISFTNKFTLPFTAANRAALGYPDMPGLETSAKTAKQPALLEADGLQVAGQGAYAVVDAVTSKGYDVIIYADNFDLIDTLDGIKLRELDTTDEDKAWTFTNVLGTIASLTGLSWPIVQNGYNRAGPINPEYLYPSVQIAYLISKAFTAIGWTLTHLDTAAEALYDKLFFAGHRPLKLSPDWLSDQYFTGDGSTSQVVSKGDPWTGYTEDFQGDAATYTTSTGGGGNFSTGTGLYTAVGTLRNVTASAEFTIASYAATGSVAGVAFFIVDPGGANEAYYPVAGFSADGTYSGSASGITIPAGCTFGLYIGGVAADTIIGGTIYFKIDSVRFSMNQADDGYGYGSWTVASYVSPDWTCWQLLRYTCNLLGLSVWADNRAKVAYLASWNNRADAVAYAPDWTSRGLAPDALSRQAYESARFTVGQFARLNYFKYRNDKTVNEDLGEYIEIINNDLVGPSTNVIEVDTGASQLDTIVSAFPTDTALVPVWNADGTQFDGSVTDRCLYIRSVEFADAVTLRDNQGNSDVFTNASVLAFDIAFDTGNSLHWANLVTNWYAPLTLIMGQMERYTIRIYLTALDIVGLTTIDQRTGLPGILTPVYLKQLNGYFLIEQVRDFHAPGLVEVDMVKLPTFNY